MKRIISFVLLLCFIVLLCGCSEQTDDSSSTAPVTQNSSNESTTKAPLRDDSKTITTEYDEFVIQIIESNDTEREISLKVIKDEIVHSSDHEFANHLDEYDYEKDLLNDFDKILNTYRNDDERSTAYQFNWGIVYSLWDGEFYHCVPKHYYHLAPYRYPFFEDVSKMWNLIDEDEYSNDKNYATAAFYDIYNVQSATVTKLENIDVGEEFVDTDLIFFEFTLPGEDKPCAIIGANAKLEKLCIKKSDSNEFRKIVSITGDGGTTYNESGHLMFQ